MQQKAKCEFYKKKINFLGFNIENGYTFSDERKESAIKEWPASKKKSKLISVQLTTTESSSRTIQIYCYHYINY